MTAIIGTLPPWQISTHAGCGQSRPRKNQVAVATAGAAARAVATTVLEATAVRVVEQTAVLVEATVREKVERVRRKAEPGAGNHAAGRGRN